LPEAKFVLLVCGCYEPDRADSVMPAWIAGFQARKDASGNFHVNLIQAIHAGMKQSRRALLEVNEVSLPSIFKGVFHDLTLAHRK